MSYREVLSNAAIAISISESEDMAWLGMSEGHLRDAMTEIARHLLALGARLVYGGDLRQHGFCDLLCELVARYTRDARSEDKRPSVVNYLAWPVHIAMTPEALEQAITGLRGCAEVVCLDIDGNPVALASRRLMASQTCTPDEWARGLSAMRRTMLANSNARIVLGGRTDLYKGAMPGVAEEALISLKARQPLYIVGGFGGCAADIAHALGLQAPQSPQKRQWPQLGDFAAFGPGDTNTALNSTEVSRLTRTHHVDEAVALILRGLSIQCAQGRP